MLIHEKDGVAGRCGASRPDPGECGQRWRRRTVSRGVPGVL